MSLRVPPWFVSLRLAKIRPMQEADNRALPERKTFRIFGADPE